MKIVTLAALVLTATAGTALAHGAAMWIENGGYMTPDGHTCCGPKDCAMEMANDVKPDGDGWLIASTGQRFTRKDPGVYSSTDAHFWTCRKYPSPMPAGNLWIKVGKKQVACLFVPTQS